jgi:hypothetical protein
MVIGDRYENLKLRVFAPLRETVKGRKQLAGAVSSKMVNSNQ